MNFGNHRNLSATHVKLPRRKVWVLYKSERRKWANAVTVVRHYKLPPVTALQIDRSYKPAAALRKKTNLRSITDCENVAPPGERNYKTSWMYCCHRRHRHWITQRSSSVSFLRVRGEGGNPLLIVVHPTPRAQMLGLSILAPKLSNPQKFCIKPWQ